MIAKQTRKEGALVDDDGVDGTLLWRHLAEARELSERVWTSHNLLAAREHGKASREKRHRFVETIIQHFGGEAGVPLEIWKALELEAAIEAIEIEAVEDDPIGGVIFQITLSRAIQLGRCREALEIHLRDGKLLDQRRKSLNGLFQKNPRSVSTKERDSVERLNKQLITAYPQKAERYREIARKLGDQVTDTRIRYIIEGPRRKK